MRPTYTTNRQTSNKDFKPMTVQDLFFKKRVIKKICSVYVIVLLKLKKQQHQGDKFIIIAIRTSKSGVPHLVVDT